MHPAELIQFVVDEDFFSLRVAEAEAAAYDFGPLALLSDWESTAPIMVVMDGPSETC